MKKMFLALAAAMMMSASAMAQEATEQQQRPSNEEMLKMRTEQMVKDYSLNEEQAAKLLELNKEYQEKIPMMGMGMGRGQRGGMRGQRPEGGNRPQAGERPQRPQGQGGERPRMNFEEMQKNMEAYQAGLEKIFTEEQMNKYKENMQNRMRGPRGNGQGGFQQRQRPQRNND